MDNYSRTVLITGSTSGIGLSCALLFAERNWNVVCLAKKSSSFSKIKKLLDGKSEQFEFHQVDFSKKDSIYNFFNKKQFKFKYIDALINSAGISTKTKIENLSENEWQDIFYINVNASFQMIRESIKFMDKSRSPTIVNISSIAGRLRSISLSCAYSSSKAAIIGMTRHLAMELSPYEIRVNCLAPGQTITPMLNSALSEKGQKNLAKNLPLKRLANPLEQAKIIYFLSSSESSYINGAIIDSNGGAL